eukprot:5128016-Prymnesium_polylepis.1
MQLDCSAREKEKVSVAGSAERSSSLLISAARGAAHARREAPSDGVRLGRGGRTRGSKGGCEEEGGAAAERTIE